MSALKKLTTLSEQDYLILEAASDVRHEYVAGQIYAMAGASERHNRISMNVAFQLRAAARGGHCGVFMSDMKLRMAESSIYYYPDVMLVCNREDDNEHYKQQPCLIAEVSSPSTANIDRREKLLAYQKIASLRYYLVINANQQQVEYFSRDAQGDWQTAFLDADETLHIECENYQTVLRLADIYEDVA